MAFSTEINDGAVTLPDVNFLSARATPAITGAMLIDGTGNPPLTNVVVFVKGDRNTKVGTAETVRIPHAARRIRAAGKFVLPGLIDTHLLLELVGLSQVGELPPE